MGYIVTKQLLARIPEGIAILVWDDGKGKSQSVEADIFDTEHNFKGINTGYGENTEEALKDLLANVENELSELNDIKIKLEKAIEDNSHVIIV